VICELEFDSLRGRGPQISEMLRPLVGSRRVAFSTAPHRNEFIIAVHSGSRPDTLPREWRFTTPIRKIRGSYWERWAPSSEKRTRYYLEQAYLQLYRRDAVEDDEHELLALHCDPNEPDDSGEITHAIYKRGPHIHVMTAQQPLPHSHFALNMGHLSDVLDSVENLSDAISLAITMIRDQVLDIFEQHDLQ
jgi:hypothetical protein